jgi:Fe-S oxidoreductase
MFLSLRQEAVNLGEDHLRPHRRLLSFERLGGSPLFRYSYLPPHCETVFYPGCSLTGARPKETMQLYRLLQTLEPTMGIVLDCCNKPSHDLGRQHFFEQRFSARMQLLDQRKIRRIITGCPSCLQAFSMLPHNFSVTTIFAVLADNDLLPPARFSGLSCRLHDPCSIRFSRTIHADVRRIMKSLGLRLTEMVHNRENTLCCGEGGGVGFTNPRLSAEWSRQRIVEAEDQLLVTYCAGCTSQLRSHGNVHHLVDLLFADTTTGKPVARTVTSLGSWLNRLMVKVELVAARCGFQLVNRR